ncbi:hypothetical protein ACFL0Z_03495 [Patescibacteria group bacterium]
MTGWNILQLILFLVGAMIAYTCYKSVEDKVTDDYEQAKRKYPKPEDHWGVMTFLGTKYSIFAIIMIATGLFLWGMTCDMTQEWRRDVKALSASSASALPCLFDIPSVWRLTIVSSPAKCGSTRMAS